MTPLETEANPNIWVGPLRWGRPGQSYASLPSDIFINAKVNGSDPVDGFFRHYAELDKVRHNFELGLSLFQPNEKFYLDLDYSTDLNPQFNNRSAAVSVGFRF